MDNIPVTVSAPILAYTAPEVCLLLDYLPRREWS